MAIASLTHSRAMKVVCWGTRGSVPTPGPATVHYGGNTSCVEIRVGDGRSLILDAGTGIIPLGRHIDSRADRRLIELFLTHFHWDHIQGLPFFAPMIDPGVTIRVHAEPQDGEGIADLLGVQMRRPYCPVSLEDMPARVEYVPLGGRPWVDGSLVVTPFRVRHPDYTCGFRIQSADATVVYIPDNEPECEDCTPTVSWADTVTEFVQGVDLLVHDAMFTDAEYVRRRGWGHGTISQAVHLARMAEVRRLLLFHHHPDRSDEQLRTIEEAVRREKGQKDATLEIEAAVEGREIVVATSRHGPDPRL